MARSCDEASWTARLRGARTTGDLIAVVQSFLATCEGSELEILSRAGVSAECASCEDVKELAVRIGTARAAAGPGTEGHARIRRLFSFLTDAASRLGHLERESPR